MGIHALPLVLILSSCLRPLQDHLHGLVVVSLDLEVRYPAVALGCGNLAMPQEVLDGSKISIGVEFTWGGTSLNSSVGLDGIRTMNKGMPELAYFECAGVLSACHEQGHRTPKKTSMVIPNSIIKGHHTRQINQANRC